MSVPVVHRWLAGDEFNAARMNEVAAAIEWLRNPPTVHLLRRSTAQTGIVATTWTKLTFDTVVNSYDPWDFYDALSPDTITIKEPGWYSIEMQFSLQGTATDGRVVMGLYKNGFALTDILMRYDQNTLPNSGNINNRKETTLFFNVGDIIYYGIYVDGFTASTAITSDAECCGMRVRWVSN